MNTGNNNYNPNYDWLDIDSRFKDMMLSIKNSDRLKPGMHCRVVNQITNEIEFGLIVYECRSWREVQQGSEFKIFSFYNHKFYAK